MTPTGNVLGSTPRRADAWEKVSGRAEYVDDLSIPGLWFGGTLRSAVPRGRLRGISRRESFDWSRVVVVTASDLPGPNEVAMVRSDHPILAADAVNFVGQPLALVAAPDRQTLAAALGALVPDVEEAPAVLTLEEAQEGRTVIWGADNVLAAYVLGDEEDAVAEAFSRADRIVEGTYTTGYQEHLYLEPQGMVALPREDGGVEVTGSLQCPYYVHRALQRALGLEDHRIAVRQAVTGGGFGGKEDYPSVLAIHAALLARASGRPVKMVLGRNEDLRFSTKRHPSVVRHRTGVRSDGTLCAAEVDVLFDGGAYTTMSPVVLSRGALHALGAYRVPRARVTARALATNTPPNGAFRGFGAPQTIFAVERHMDLIARELGISPLEVRRRNLLRRGDRLPCGQILTEEPGASLVLERAQALAKYETRHGTLRKEGRGLGLSLFIHGGGFTGSGEEKIDGRVAVEIGAGGRVEILASSTEMGQGAATVLPQIGAQALGLPLDRIFHPAPATDRVPDSGPTVASRTVMVVGRILVGACEDLAAKVARRLEEAAGLPEGSVTWREGTFRGPGFPEKSFEGVLDQWKDRLQGLRGEGRYAPFPDLHWDDDAYRGDAYKDYSWGANVVEVAVDPDRHTLTLCAVTAVVEIGRAVHPLLAEGQVAGGTLQALGYGGMEDLRIDDRGRYLQDRLSTYSIPTALDAPDLVVEIAEIPSPRGPFGAKGLGELPINGGAPALASAVEDATGVFIPAIPITGERLFAHRRDGLSDEPS